MVTRIQRRRIFARHLARHQKKEFFFAVSNYTRRHSRQAPYVHLQKKAEPEYRDGFKKRLTRQLHSKIILLSKNNFQTNSSFHKLVSLYTEPFGKPEKTPLFYKKVIFH